MSKPKLWGGSRKNAGRPSNGRVKRNISVGAETNWYFIRKARGKRTLGTIVDQAVKLLWRQESETKLKAIL